MTDLALLGLDVGTSSSKAIVLSQDGRELARGRVEYSLSYLGGGRVELDLTVVWAAVTTLIRQVTAQAGASGGAVRAISLSVSGDEAIPVAADGRHLRPCIMAMDNRTASLAERVRPEGRAAAPVRHHRAARARDAPADAADVDPRARA